MRKAQGISINAIIIAAIALIVLVVLIAIFTGRMGIFGKELSDQKKGMVVCGENGLGGEWMSPSDCEAAGRAPYYNPLKDTAENSQGGAKVCCLPLEEKTGEANAE